MTSDIIPLPSVPVTDPRTGIMAVPWYDYFRAVAAAAQAAAASGASGLGSGVRFAATRCRWLTASDTSKHQIMARSGHKAWADLKAVEIFFQNARNSSANLLNDFSGEVGLGSPATLTASIEYPAGTFKQVLFGSSSTGTIADVSVLKSNQTTVNIPKDAIFWVRQFWSNPSGIVYNAWQDVSTYGDAVQAAASGVVDQTMGGTVVDNSGWSFPPAAIVGVHDQMSIGIVGDSIGYGNVGPPHEVAPFLGQTGVIAKSLIDKVPLLNLSQCGAGAHTANPSRYWISSGTIRRQLVQYCTHIICQLAINDMSGAAATNTALQEVADLQALWALLKSTYSLPASAEIIQTTCTPHSTSTDGWHTVANQTGSFEVTSGERGAFNDLVRTGIAGASSQFYEIAGALESSHNSGLWAVVAGSSSNLLADSNNFSGPTWFQSQLASFNFGAADPFSGNTASTMVENTAGGPHYASDAVSAPAGTYIASIYAKSSNRRPNIRVAAPGGTDFIYASFDLAGVQVGTTGTGGAGFSLVGAAIVSAGSGFFRCSLTFTTTTTLAGFFLVMDNATGTAALSQNYTGDGASNIVYTRAMLEAGSTLNPWTEGTAAPTDDGLHPTDAGYAAISIPLPAAPASGQTDSVVALIDSASGAVTLDASLGDQFKLVAAGNRTIQAPINVPAAGSSKRITIIHEASGGARTLSLATTARGFRFGSDITGLTATPAGLVDYIDAIWNEADGFWDVTGYTRGF